MRFDEPRFEGSGNGRAIVLYVPQSDHAGEQDPVPHVLRWANAQGLSCTSVQHRLADGGRCKFTFRYQPAKEVVP